MIVKIIYNHFITYHVNQTFPFMVHYQFIDEGSLESNCCLVIIGYLKVVVCTQIGGTYDKPCVMAMLKTISIFY